MTAPQYADGEYGLCDEMTNHDCLLTSYAWAIGGGKNVFPKDLGVPIGPNSVQYVMLQIHYDNPQLLSGQTDSSGIRMSYTKNLRQHDVGMFMTGRREAGILVPPQVKSYDVKGHCNSECTTNLIPPTGINVLSTLLHTHLLGRKALTQIIRNGTEIEPLLKIDYYDFNFQDFIFFDQPRKLYPGDRIITHCNYDSTERTEPTPGGKETREEMCYTFFHYYPKQDQYSFCVDATPPDGTNPSLFCGFNRLNLNPDAPFTPLVPNKTDCPPVEEDTVQESEGSRMVVNAVAMIVLVLSSLY